MDTNFRWDEKSRLVHSQICHMIIYNLVPDKIVIIEINKETQKLADDHKIRKNLVGMPDYAVDKHTAKGRQLGRGIKDFIESGGVLVNEDQNWKELSQIYLSMCKF